MIKAILDRFLKIFRGDNQIADVGTTTPVAESGNEEINHMPEYVGDGKVCPFCTSTDTLDIVYGYVRSTSKEDVESNARKSILGGCVTDKNSPAFYCEKCGKNFGLDAWSQNNFFA